MGSALYGYFEKAGQLGGIKARTKLSILTKTSSLQAKSLVDSPENIRQFDYAMQKVSEEFKEIPEKLASRSSIFESSTEINQKLRRYFNAFVDLAAQRALYMGNLKAIYQRITETISYTINIERASIWLMNESQNGIVCIDLFSQSNGEHSEGMFLEKKDFPIYFKSIQSERTISANNALTDPRTMEFSEVYLKPLGITSMMDVPVWVEGKMAGIICHEHTGQLKTWTVDEENFAYLMSNIVAMAIENNTTNKKLRA